MGETRWNGVSTAKVFKIAMDVIANRFPGKKMHRISRFCIGLYNLKILPGLYPRRGRRRPPPSWLFAVLVGRDGGCLDPDTNFRLARQRFHCYCFTQDAMNFTQYLLILRGVVPLRHMAPDSIAICDSG